MSLIHVCDLEISFSCHEGGDPKGHVVFVLVVDTLSEKSPSLPESRCLDYAPQTQTKSWMDPDTFGSIPKKTRRSFCSSCSGRRQYRPKGSECQLGEPPSHDRCRELEGSCPGTRTGRQSRCPARQVQFNAQVVAAWFERCNVVERGSHYPTLSRNSGEFDFLRIDDLGDERQQQYG